MGLTDNRCLNRVMNGAAIGGALGASLGDLQTRTRICKFLVSDKILVLVACLGLHGAYKPQVFQANSLFPS